MSIDGKAEWVDRVADVDGLFQCMYEEHPFLWTMPVVKGERSVLTRLMMPMSPNGGALNDAGILGRPVLKW